MLSSSSPPSHMAFLNSTLGGATRATWLLHEEGPKEIRPWEKNAWNVCEAYVNFTSSGEESVVTMRGRRGKNNAVTCFPDGYMPVDTVPQLWEQRHKQTILF